MTKEELKKEAYEWTVKNISAGISMYNPSIEMYCGKAFKDGAEPREKRIAELEAENERLKGDLELWESGACRATNLDKCDVIKDVLKLDEEKIVELEKENARLTTNEKSLIAERKIIVKENAELKDKLEKWKGEWQEQVQKENDESYARTLQTIQLTKAKNILQFVSEYEDMTCYADELEEIKQFLKELEK